MMQTVEAVIDEKGKIHFLESVKLEAAPHRVLVTILPIKSQSNKTLSAGLDNLGEILDDDLEGASREIAKKFNEALNESASKLEN